MPLTTPDPSLQPYFLTSHLRHTFLAAIPLRLQDTILELLISQHLSLHATEITTLLPMFWRWIDDLSSIEKCGRSAFMFLVAGEKVPSEVKRLVRADLQRYVVFYYIPISLF